MSSWPASCGARRDDDYAAAGKPACDYDDPAAREALAGALARDARALVAALDGREPGPALAQAAPLLATVTGPDLEQDAAGAAESSQDTGTCADGAETAAGREDPEVYGDAAYGSGELLERVEAAGIHPGLKVQPPAAVTGHFPRDRFAIDLDGKTVTCPAGVMVPIRARTGGRHAGEAKFGPACRSCPLAARCTSAKQGRTITIGPHEARLAAARDRQATAEWQASYKATRPKVERKIGHLMRRRHGGRRARVRGQTKVAAGFALLAAAVNLARLGVPGLACHGGNRAVNAS